MYLCNDCAPYAEFLPNVAIGYCQGCGAVLPDDVREEVDQAENRLAELLATAVSKNEGSF